MGVGHALLGVLAQGAAHGYDLKQEHDARFPGAKSLPFGQVYASLARLERDGLIEVAGRTRESGPDKTIYALTEAGHDALRTWLTQTEQAGPYAADDLVRKTVTALRLGADATAFLRRQRDVHLARMKELVAIQDAATDIDSRIAIDHTISHLDADLQWLETAAARVASAGKEPA